MLLYIPSLASIMPYPTQVQWICPRLCLHFIKKCLPCGKTSTAEYSDGNCTTIGLFPATTSVAFNDFALVASFFFVFIAKRPLPLQYHIGQAELKSRFAFMADNNIFAFHCICTSSSHIVRTFG